MSREKVSQLRKLLSEATPSPTVLRNDAENEAWRHYQQFESFTAPPPLEASPRARAIREITRIAAWYGWSSEIQRELDDQGVGFVSSLDDDALSLLRSRMKQLEECAQHGIGPPDAPPAT